MDRLHKKEQKQKSMKTLEKYKLLSKKWRLFSYLSYYSSSALPILSLLFVLLFSFNQQGFTQNYFGHQFVKGGQPTVKAYEKAGAKAFKRENYPAAMEHYRNALTIDSTKIDNYFQLGLAARAFDANIEAKEAFAMVKILNDPLNPYANYKDAIYYYSVIEKELGNVDNAVVLKEELDATYSVPKYTFTKINNMEDWAQIKEICYDEVRDASSQITVTHLDSTVNTIHSEVNPFWRNGKLHYTSLRFPKENDTHSPARLYAKTLHGELGTEGDAWDDMNVENKTTAHFTFDPIDTTLLYFTLCDYTQDKKSTIDCQIYYRQKNNGVWSIPHKVSDLINQPNYTATHPSIGFNDLDEKVLFYVSDRPGGKGGLDIWAAPIIGPNNFGKPELLPINTTKNDITPFYHHASNTLYFSSQGHKKWEHYDVYKIKNILTDTIEPLPYPINSNADDFGYFLEPDTKRGFMVSSRADCNELESGEWACHDIFQIDYNCAPKLHIELVDSETNVALAGGEVTLRGVGENGITELENLQGNNFITTALDTSLTYILRVEKKGYNSIDKEYKITICDTIKEKILLYKECPDKHIIITLIDEKGELINEPNATIIIDGEITSCKIQKGNAYIYAPIVKDSIFQVEVGAQRGYKSVIIDTMLVPCDSIQIQLRLDPTEKEEYNTIACYFDHDVPKKITPFNLLINDYSKYSRKQNYINGFTDKDGKYSKENKKEVIAFFANKVDTSFAILERFRDDLLKALPLLHPDSSYILTIRGYTSDIGNTDYNDALATRRIQSVWQYFTMTHAGKFGKYVATNKLYLEDLPLGEDKTKPIFERKDGLRNTTFNPISAKKRRIEIIRKKKGIPPRRDISLSNRQ